ncbi:MAG: 50S ribosomal protein L11 methyltransferase [Chitinophagales bacterium]|nr:50S ribosomal protein L11 methyltransferase [Chitinophagales bacterium]
MNNYKKLIINIKDTVDVEDFSGNFFDLDVEGIEVKEQHIEVYFQENELATLLDSIEDLSEAIESYTVEEVENKNWNQIWEEQFQPIQIENDIFIRASFHQANPICKYDILIEPKMSFGTGHHATTYQAMQHLLLLDNANKKVLDCGSGTGILAILSSLLGASEVVAIDNDEWCFINVQENIVLNNTLNIQPVLGELSNLEMTSFDIILANIHKNYLLENQQLLTEKLVKNGKIILSGFYIDDVNAILDAYQAVGMQLEKQTDKDNWACLTLKKL